MTDTESGPVALGNETASPVLTGVTPLGSSEPEQNTTADPWASIPKIGAYRTADHRYFWNGQGPYPSVTTILKILDKPALVQWAKRNVAETAVLKMEELTARVLKDGNEEAIRWLVSLPDYQRDIAATLGTNVHALADMESRAEAFEVSEQEKPYLEAFRNFLTWLEAHGGVIVSSEKMVYSSEGYCGTYDLLIRFPDTCPFRVLDEGCHWQGLACIDVKTSKGYYPEYALQLVGYGRADAIILPNDPTPYPMPKLQRYGVLHLRPDQYTEGWRLIQYPVTDRDYLAFLAALELSKWKEEGRFTRKALTEGEKTKVIQDPLTTNSTKEAEGE